MLVYRIEFEDGIGPYQRAERNRPAIVHAATVLLERHDDSYHPCVWADVSSFRSTIHFCCFDSWEQMFDWFADDLLEMLGKAGALLATYDVPMEHVLFGNHQSAFDKAQAKLVALDKIS